MKTINKEINYKNKNQERLDIFLASILLIKRALCQKNISQGNVFVNLKEVKKNYLLKENDNITLKDFIIDDSLELTKVCKNLDIVFENDDYAIINKEKNLVVYPGIKNTEDSLCQRLIFLFGKNNLCQKDTIRPGIVHRLDKETSGLIIICKNDEYYNYLKDEFKKRKVIKKYYAILEGCPKEVKKRLVDKISKCKTNPIKKEVTPCGKECILDYEIIKKNDKLSLADITLITGRQHQIRVQMKNINHPLAGDSLYSGLNYFKTKGFYLCCYSLSFYDYKNKKQVLYQIKPPQDFLKIIEQMSDKLD